MLLNRSVGNVPIGKGGSLAPSQRRSRSVFRPINSVTIYEDSFEKSIEEAQRTFCAQHGADYVPSRSEAKSGFALSTKGLAPINGLRHPPTADTTGWYIWCGEQFSEADDFFDPVHTRHLYEDYPQLVKLLGLPPGYRFLLAGDYLDVWYDASLQKID
jgi:hypothetical protein